MDPSGIPQIVSSLPLPLAQALRRAVNAKSPNEQHNGAYYFFESALKLAASAQIGAYLALNAPKAELNALLENLARPSTGHWLALLRETSAYLSSRSDAALLPLADVYSRLSAKQAMPAARAFLEFAAQAAGKAENRQSLRVLDVFDAIVAYRNHELGHGAMRERGFYSEAAPLLLDAILECLRVLRPIGELRLAVSRDVVDPRTQKSARRFDILSGDGLHVPFDANTADAQIPSGRLLLVGGATRVQLHPLLVYEIDSLDRDRVGFLNHVATVGRDTTKLKRVEYLDYDSGDRLDGHDALAELAGLFSKLRGTEITQDTVENLTRFGEAPAAAPADARQRIGDFEIIEELGRGGMGIVYKARQQSLGRTVALKVLPPSLAGDPVSVARFKREIAALGRCDHPNVVKVLTAGVDGERHFYAMEYVEGADLSRVCGVLSRWKSASGGSTSFREGHLLRAISGSKPAADKNLPEVPKAETEVPQISEGRDYFVRLAELIADAAEGVQHLHEHGIIHRDIKPANIMLTQDGRRAVIMDLGLAQLQDRSLSLTASSVKILGTLRYMPPEQLQHQMLEVTPRADIYSLGATLYELAALAPIFNGDSEAKLIQQVLQEEPIAPRAHNPAMPRDLETVIISATAKAPNERYAAANLLANDLRAFSKGEPISMRAPSAFHYLRLFYRKNKPLVAAAAIAAALLLAVTVWFVVSLDASRKDALDQRDIAEKQRQEADTQRGLAIDNAADALAQKIRAEAETKRAEGEKKRAEENEAAAKEAAKKAREAELKSRERLALGLLTNGSALNLAGRHAEAKASFLEALAIQRELGQNDFEAQCGLTRCFANDPPPLLEFGETDFGRIYDIKPAGAGRVFLGAEAGVIEWDVAAFKPVRNFGSKAGSVTALAVSPDGARLASGAADGRILIWDIATAAVVHELWGHILPIQDVCWRKDGRQLASICYDTSMRLWDPATGECTHEASVQDAQEGYLAYCGDGTRMVSTGDDNSLRIHDLATGKMVFDTTDEKSHFTRLVTLPDGGFLVGRSNGAIERRASTGALVREIGKLQGRVSCLAIDQDARRVVGGAAEGSWGLFEIETGAEIARSRVALKFTTAMCFCAGKLVCADGFSRLSQWTEAGSMDSEVGAHGEQLLGMLLAPKSRRLYVLCEDCRVRAWDTWTSLRAAGYHDTSMEAQVFALSPDESTLATGSFSGEVEILDALTLKPRARYKPGGINVEGLAFSPDGKKLLCAVDSKLAVMNAEDGAGAVWLKGPVSDFNFTTRFLFSPDGRQVAAAGNFGGAVIWELAAPDKPRSIEKLGGPALALAFSDNATLLAGTNGRVVAINLADLEVKELVAGLGWIDGLCLLADGKTLVVMTRNNEANLVFFDIAAGKTVRSVSHTPRLQNVVLEPDGSAVYCVRGARVVALSLQAEPFTGLALPPSKARYFVEAVLPGNRLALVLIDGELSLFCLATMSVLRKLSPRGMVVSWAAYDARRQQAMYRTLKGHFGLVELTGKELFAEEISEQGLANLDFDATTERIAISENDGSLRVFPLGVFRGEVDPDSDEGLDLENLCHIAWSADGAELVVLVNDRTVVIVDPISGAVHRGLMGGPSDSWILGLAVSPDGRHLATFHANGLVCLWDYKTGRFLRQIGAKGEPEALSVSFSGDGGFLAWSNSRGTRLWDLALNREIFTALGGEGESYVRFSGARGELLLRAGPGNFSVEFLRSGEVAFSLAAAAATARTSLAAQPADPSALAALGQWYACRGFHDRAVHFLTLAKDLKIEHLDVLAHSLWLHGRKTGGKPLIARAAATFKALQSAASAEARVYYKCCAEACETEAK